MDAARAEIGLIGGTGLYDMPGLVDVEEIALETPFGRPSTPLRVGTLGGRRVAFLARHGHHHALLPSEVPYRANVYALRHVGVRRVFAVGAVGSLREDLPPRTVVVPDQAIDLTRRRALSFFGDGVVAHVGFGEPFDAGMRRAWIEGARAAGLAVVERGCYVTMEGPQFSSAAESRMYRTLGGDVVGMTNGTEARLAREAEIAYATICFVTDYDAWREGEAAVEAPEIFAIIRACAAATAKAAEEAVRRCPTGDAPAHRALASGLVTPVARIPAAARVRLAAILAPYLDAD
jgi:5'-methylthioadenosine phosphorylase